RPPLLRGSRNRRAASGPDDVPTPVLVELRTRSVRHGDSKDLAVESCDAPSAGLTQPHRVLDQRLQDRLEVEGRAADDLEYLAGGRLLLQGLGQLAVAGLQLLEEAHVLDGDRGLGRERLQERNLLIRER